MPVLLDASTPAFVTGTANPATTASFTPPASAAIFAICMADESNTFSVSNTGTALTWASIGTPINQAGEGSIAVFRAYTGNTSPGAITVSGTRTGSFVANALQVLVFTGAEATYTGAYAKALTATVNIVTTAANSWIWAGHVEENGTADTAASGCAFQSGPTSFGGIDGGVLKRTATTPTSGTSVTIGVTGATTPDVVAFEVKEAASTGNTAFAGIWPGTCSPGLQRLHHQTSFTTPFQLLGSTDAASGPVNYTKSTSDNVGITDTTTNARGTAASDAVGITDSVRVSVTKGITDPVGITDTRAYNDGENYTDPVGLTDSASRTVTAVRAPADNVGITDARTAARGKTQADAVGITDSVTGVISLLKTVNDSIGITDGTTKSRGESPGEAVGLTDAVSVTKTVVRTVSDAVGVTDTRAYNDGENYVDPLPITDTRSVARGTSRTDPVGITDARTVAVGRTRTDPVGITDTRTAARGKTVANAVGVTDTATAARSFHVIIDDPVGITDFIPTGIVRDICVSLTGGPRVQLRAVTGPRLAPHTLAGPRVTRVVTGPADVSRSVESLGAKARTVAGPQKRSRAVTGPGLRPLVTSEGIQPRTVDGPRSC